jgi:hypothetical protein
MSIADRDPVYIVCAIRDMILNITASVFSVIDFGYERAIKDRQEQFKGIKAQFATDCGAVVKGTAPAGTSFESLKAEYDKKKKELSDFVTDTNNLRNKLNLSSLYIDMGINALVSNFMCAYGVAAADTPSIQLKGSGDIILKADKTKNLYVTKQEVGGSPVGAVHEVVDTVKFGVNAFKAASDVILAGTKLGYKTKKYADDKKAADEKKEASDPYRDEDTKHEKNVSNIMALSSG